MQRLLSLTPAPRGDHGRIAWLLLAARVIPGAVFMVTGIGKFVTFQSEVAAFRSFGIPAPEVMVVLAGLLEAIGGLLLILGLAIGTAGRVVGGPFHLGVAPALLVLMLVLVWSGATKWSLDTHLLARLGGPVSRA